MATIGSCIACQSGLETSPPLTASTIGAITTYAGSRQSLAQSLNLASKENLMARPYVAPPTTPIATSIFDMFKVGPGPSSSHTIGPMKAAFDFLQDLRQRFGDLEMSPFPDSRFRIEINLFGSLSATGKGHGTDIAIVGGLLGWLPPTCDPVALRSLMRHAGQTYKVPICVNDLDPTSTDSSSHKSLVEVNTCLGKGDALQEVGTPSTIGEDINYTCFPLADVAVGSDSFVWHDPNEATDYPHPNTVVLRFIDEYGQVHLEGEYYSLGGGFIQKKGYQPEDARDVSPPYPYTNFKELTAHLDSDKDLTWAELMMSNEVTLSGMTRLDIENKIDEIIGYMERAVERGLATRGLLPGTIKLNRKAADVYEHARKNNLRADNFLNFLNAYCYAASEENAAGNVVVTAPTSGASGVFPGLIYFMKHHLFYSPKVIREALMVGGCIGFIVKRNASISGAEMGCMGEVGTASAMGAAMLSYAAGLSVPQIEAAAEMAIEHHLGLTCDPVGGYVQVPCIQRNPFGAVKAYNSFLMAVSSDPGHQVIHLDLVIKTMRETGHDMHKKYKETSEGGLAANFTFC